MKIYKNVLSYCVLKNVLTNKAILFLFSNSHFKYAQLDSLLSQRRGELQGLMKEDVIGLRDYKTSVGSMQRSARQAELVISKSIATLILGILLGFISPEVVQALLRVERALSGIQNDKMSDEQIASAVELLRSFLLESSRK